MTVSLRDRLPAGLEIAREQQAPDRGFRQVFCNATPLTTLFHNRHLFGGAPAELEELARRPYSRTIFCALDFAFVQDGTRMDEAFRRRQDARCRQQLGQMKVSRLEAAGTPAESAWPRLARLWRAAVFEHLP